jgi:beta-xylosidase
MTRNSTGNPIITHTFTSDPSVIVDGETVYLYTGHDEAAVGESRYVMNEWLCFSSTDLRAWRQHPSPLRFSDFAWAEGGAYAPTVVARGRRYYFYAPVRHKSIGGCAIGVAVADSPTGPFADALGYPLITGDLTSRDGVVNIDPTVLVDDDGRAYMFWGKGRCFRARLAANMIELDGEVSEVQFPGFEEGAHLHKRNGWYYFTYGFGSPERVAYAMSRSIDGPWQFRSILNELAGNCETNRPAIVEFKGNAYFFYHTGGLPTGGSHRRSVCIDDLHYDADGTMRRVVMTSQGVGPV